MEEFLKLVWTRHLYTNETLYNREGHPVSVLSHGHANTSDGTDIAEVSIKIGETTYTGPAAVHCNASDWHKHLHHIDPQYDNCVLHIVLNDDAVICRTNGSLVPTIKIDYPEQLGDLYKQLTGEHSTYKCGRILTDMEPIHRYEIITRLTIERLERKFNDFKEQYHQTGNDWNETFYIMLFRYMGSGSNQEAYMKLAKTIRYSDICRIRESIVDVEALLLGGAGLLEGHPDKFPDKYTITLQQEFDHLRRRFNITPMRSREWVINRNNLYGHPVIRIVELAALLASRDFLFSNLLNCRTIDEMRKILSAEASDYWTSHYHLGRLGDYGIKRIGETMQNTLCINFVIPMMFTHGQVSKDQSEKDRALDLLDQIPAEKNKYLNGWKLHGVTMDNAFFTQGMLQLTKEYCKEKRCAVCNIGKMLLCSQ